jgi:hypothetical protein
VAPVITFMIDTADGTVWIEQQACGRLALAMGNERFPFQDPQQMRLLAAAIEAQSYDTGNTRQGIPGGAGGQGAGEGNSVGAG